MTKIPPGEYSEENGKLRKYEGNLAGYADSSYGIKYIDPLFTIGFHLEGITELEVGERSAEEVLREYVSFEDVNGNDTVEMLPLTIVDCMEEYRSQPIAPVSEKETSAQILSLIDSYWKFDGRQFPMSNWHDKQDLMDEIRKLFKSLHRTQSGYTREQVIAFAQYITENNYSGGYNRDGEDYHWMNDSVPKTTEQLFNEWSIPSLTSVTIGDNNNIIDFKYK